MDLTSITTLIAEIMVFVTVMTPCVIVIICLINGMKCLLRSDMLDIYYKGKDTETIRQYELQNFVLLYKAYKALKGNSFIDKIYNDVMNWEVLT